MSQRDLRPGRLFTPAPFVAAVLVLLVGSALPIPPLQHPDGTRSTTTAAAAPTIDEPVSVTVVPESATESRAPAAQPAPHGPLGLGNGTPDVHQAVAVSNQWSLPNLLLEAYRRAASGAPPSCHLPVSLLAAIGQVESGSLAGRSLDAAHRAVPPVLGPVLDGQSTAAITDTDGGRLDGNSRWDRAVGPMQFIPGTWSVFGVDGDGDGQADPQNVYDAAAAAAGYLCHGGRDLALDSDLRSAVLAYNHSNAYLTTVIAWQHRFAASRGGATWLVNDVLNTATNLPARVTLADATSHPTVHRTGMAVRQRTPTRTPSSPVVVRTATTLVFTAAPSPTTTSGTAWATQPAVTVQDDAGNTVTTDASSVTLSLTTPAGAALTCTANPTAAMSGVATFTGCTIDKAGTYTLTATATATATGRSLTSATSSTVTVSAASAAKLVFSTEPSTTATSGTAWATQPAVTVQDDAGNTVTTDASSVTLSLTTPAGAALTCTTNPTAAMSGVAIFAGCTIDKAGTYRLIATDGLLPSATSTTVTVHAGAPAMITVISGSDQSATVNHDLARPLVARVTDLNANPVALATVTFRAPAAGASGTFANTTATTTALTDTDGQATSGVVTANTTADLYHLSATAGSVVATFTVTNSPEAASTFVITSAPAAGPASTTATLGPITVQIRDPFGNPVPAPTGGTKVTLSSDSAGTTAFATTLAGPSVTSVTILSGKSSASFFYGDTVPGRPLITASGALVSAIQVETILVADATADTAALASGP